MKVQFSKFIFIFVIAIFITKDSVAFNFWNQACQFIGGSSSYIAAGNTPTINLNSGFTLEAWIHPVNSVSPGTQVILAKNFQNKGYSLFLNNGRVSVSTNSVLRLTGNTIIENNKWTHVAATYNSISGEFRILINGILDNNAIIAAATPAAHIDSLRVGRDTLGNGYAGFMDNVRIWNRALNDSDITKYRRTALGVHSGPYIALVLSYTFENKNAGSTLFNLTDWTGNGNNGRNNGVSALDQSNRPSNTVAPNECLELQGNGYLAGADNPDVSPTTAVTLEAWIYPKTFPSKKTIILKGTEDGSSVNYGIHLDSGGKISATINNNTSYNSVNSIPVFKWSHIAFSYSGLTGYYAFYINGKKVNEGTNNNGVITDGNDSLFIGGSSATGRINAFLDEVRISNYAKTQVQIGKYLFQSIDASNEPNPLSTNVVYNLDGYSQDNCSSGPDLIFRAGSRFSHSGATDDQPVSPLLRASDVSFSQGFYFKNSGKSIPETGTQGWTFDTLEVFYDKVITDMEVYVALNHNAVSQLRIVLVAPNQDSVVLFDDDSLVTNADNVVTIFDDNADSSLTLGGKYVSYSPKIKPKNSILAKFNGINGTGKWILRILNKSDLGSGELVECGIRFDGVTEASKTLNLQAFIQGFYRPATDSMIIGDTITIECRINNSPYQQVGYKTDPIDSRGISNIIFDLAGTLIDPEEEYFLVIRQRHSVETWSSEKITFPIDELSTSYDFTSMAGRAFGNNQIQVDSLPENEFALYGGDLDNNGFIDGTDLAAIDNNLSASGNVLEDVNGDGFVDGSDALIVDNNLNVGVITPP